jgi:mxaJ protein
MKESMRHALCIVGCLCALCLREPLARGADAAVLRVCSDPNNLPFSNRDGAGFEDQLAKLLAAQLGTRVEHFYWAQRRGFLRNTLKAGACDVVMGVPSSLDMVLTSEPYYRSSYVFVSRVDRGLNVRSLRDPRLRSLKLGVPVVGDDYQNPPPVHALSRRGIVDNVVGFSVFGDYAQDSPPLELVRAVERGSIDVALAWGPAAGYVAKHSRHPLRIAPLLPARDGPYPFVFDISLGVRKDDLALKRQLDVALRRLRPQIRQLLGAYGVPRV